MDDSTSPSTVHLGLGANLGEPEKQVIAALDAVGSLPATSVEAVSAPYRTEPRIIEDQPEFLNACATIETGLGPRKLLDELQRIERDYGRQKTREKGPRRLDLDILLWGDREINRDHLTIPHPGLADRRFVLSPLADIAPEVRDPRSGSTIRELLAACEDAGDVERLDWSDRDGLPRGTTRR